jgi:hypothetical protein
LSSESIKAPIKAQPSHRRLHDEHGVPLPTEVTMTLDTRAHSPALTARVDTQPTLDVSELEGWQALAAASLGRLLTGPELAAAERLPVDLSLDLLFPHLGDAARHEALWALDDT